MQLAYLYPRDIVVNKSGVTLCLHSNGQKQTIIMLNSMLDYGEKRGKVINARKRWGRSLQFLLRCSKESPELLKIGCVEQRLEGSERANVAGI